MEQAGLRMSAAVETQLSAEELVRYAETGETDKNADQFSGLLRDLTEQLGLDRVAVVRGSTLVFDSAAQVDGVSQTKLLAEDLFSACLPKLEKLRSADAMKTRDAAGTRYLVTMDPVEFRDGTVAGYVLTAAPVESMTDHALIM